MKERGCVKEGGSGVRRAREGAGLRPRGTIPSASFVAACSIARPERAGLRARWSGGAAASSLPLVRRRLRLSSLSFAGCFAVSSL